MLNHRCRPILHLLPPSPILEPSSPKPILATPLDLRTSLDICSSYDNRFSQDSPADVDMCDVTAWYTEMTAEDVFSDPSPEVAAIEEEIKELISSGDQDAVLVSCAVLASYEETLLGPTDDSDLHEDTVDTGQSEEFDDSEAAEDPGESENSLGEDLTLENIVADILEDGGDWDGKVKNELLHDKDRESNSPGEDSQEDPSLEEEQRTDGSEPEGQPPETMETVGLPTDLEGDSPGADSEETCTKGGGSGRCDPKEGCHMWESSTKVRPNNGGAPGEGHSDKEVDDKVGHTLSTHSLDSLSQSLTRHLLTQSVRHSPIYSTTNLLNH